MLSHHDSLRSGHRMHCKKANKQEQYSDLELDYKRLCGGLYPETRIYDIKKGTISNRESERYGEPC